MDLGLPDLTQLKEMFSFNMNTVKLGTMMTYLESNGHSQLTNDISNSLREVEVGLLTFVYL